MRMLYLVGILAGCVSMAAHAQPSSPYTVSAPPSNDMSIDSQRAISIAFLGRQQPSHNDYPVTAVPFPAFADSKDASRVAGDAGKARVVVPLLAHAPIAANDYPLVTVPSATME
jgi:hypothetical protein